MRRAGRRMRLNVRWHSQPSLNAPQQAPVSLLAFKLDSMGELLYAHARTALLAYTSDRHGAD